MEAEDTRSGGREVVRLPIVGNTEGVHLAAVERFDLYQWEWRLVINGFTVRRPAYCLRNSNGTNWGDFGGLNDARAELDEYAADQERALRLMYDKQCTTRIAGRTPATPDAGESVVYCVTAASVDVVKIGTTTNINRRLKNLSASSPVRLSVYGWIYGGHAVESKIHSTFCEYRRHGEWFDKCDQILGYFDRNGEWEVPE